MMRFVLAVVSRVIGVVVNALLIYGTIVYTCFIGLFLPCTRGTGPFTSSNSGHSDPSTGSGGCGLQLMDVLFWLLPFAMHVPPLYSYFTTGNWWTRTTVIGWLVGPVLVLWLARLLFIRQRDVFHAKMAKM